MEYLLAAVKQRVCDNMDKLFLRWNKLRHTPQSHPPPPPCLSWKCAVCHVIIPFLHLYLKSKYCLLLWTNSSLQLLSNSCRPMSSSHGNITNTWVTSHEGSEMHLFLLCHQLHDLIKLLVWKDMKDRDAVSRMTCGLTVEMFDSLVSVFTAHLSPGPWDVAPELGTYLCSDILSVENWLWAYFRSNRTWLYLSWVFHKWTQS